jgi:hypothetical protein
LLGSVFILCSDNTELSAMAVSISSNYDVVLAHNINEAASLFKKNQKARLAYVEISSDMQSSIQQIYNYGRLGMEVIALVKPPCPEPVLEAYKRGRILDILEFPIDLIKFYTKTCYIMTHCYQKGNTDNSLSSILTQEEIQFILNTYKTDYPTALASNN